MPTLTWFVYTSSTRGTSFASSYQKSIKTKLLFDELPVLEIMKHRRPDLYSSQLTCFCCNYDNETLDHLWTCPSCISNVNSIISKSQNLLFAKLLANNESADLTAIKTNPIWTWQHSNQFVSDLLFARGIILLSLVDQISAITHSQEYTFTLIGQLHDHLMDLFILDIWMPRNDKLKEFEESLGIKSEDKKRSRTPDLSYDKPTLGPIIQQSLLKPWSYMKWMYNSIIFGYTWSDFPISLNK